MSKNNKINGEKKWIINDELYKRGVEYFNYFGELPKTKKNIEKYNNKIKELEKEYVFYIENKDEHKKSLSISIKYEIENYKLKILSLNKKIQRINELIDKYPNINKEYSEYVDKANNFIIFNKLDELLSYHKIISEHYFKSVLICLINDYYKTVFDFVKENKFYNYLEYFSLNENSKIRFVDIRFIDKIKKKELPLILIKRHDEIIKIKKHFYVNELIKEEENKLLRSFNGLFFYKIYYFYI